MKGELFKTGILKWTLVLACLLFLMFWYVKADQKITVVEGASSQAWLIPYEDAESLTNDVDLVVTGTVMPGMSQTISIPSVAGGSRHYTATEIKVEQVLKNNGQAAENQTLPIVEPTYIIDKGLVPGKIEFPLEHYRKALPGGKYLLFLKWSDNLQKYWVHAGYQGKYNLDGKDVREMELSVEIPKYVQLKEKVKQKYNQVWGMDH
ncbi:hypothetical protein KP806_04250 [Paenibacillus sp. N4]|uniref:hypothetical protein n=1 Tax=Paenibacillus vietnamensis TaxID=2590547 RepID=UPI001CD180BF|nr:hypothetical protein [Paenibacillus vietnamensis]MCA0754247.1 hypothetical protein [Paenibacillus vietnamensis]